MKINLWERACSRMRCVSCHQNQQTERIREQPAPTFFTAFDRRKRVAFPRKKNSPQLKNFPKPLDVQPPLPYKAISGIFYSQQENKLMDEPAAR
jgi:hypothetical protein